MSDLIERETVIDAVKNIVDWIGTYQKGEGKRKSC